VAIGQQLSTEEFNLIRQLVYDRFGIHLNEQKKSLVVERLQKTLRVGRFESFRAYYEHVVNDRSGQAVLELIDRISTNHTSFFREKDHFVFMQTTWLPALKKKALQSGSKNVRIWSAGCSSGEEPYTIAMLLADLFEADHTGWDLGVLATDISTTVLEKAQAGIYSDTQLESVPDTYKRKYFKQTEDGLYAVNQAIKNQILFRRLNLMNKEYPFKGQFQIIFCRNVMIYFDEPVREGLLERYHRYLEPNGYLFIGHSESIGRDNKYFRFIRPAIYQKI
jgi:chemotaxis protein methyltransferase CheR